MNDKVTSVLIVGVGGQGVILAGEIMAKVAFKAGCDVKKSEVHGMAQRGGSVNAQIRFGNRVRSPIIPRGETDVLLSFEGLEALRWAAACNAGTLAIINDQRIHSPTASAGLQQYPDDVIEKLRGGFKKLHLVPAMTVARELGDPRIVNVVMLGLLARTLDFPKETWTEALKAHLKPELIDINMKAFERGLGLADVLLTSA